MAVTEHRPAVRLTEVLMIIQIVLSTIQIVISVLLLAR